MKKTIILLLPFLLLSCSSEKTSQRAIALDKNIEARVDSVMQQMSLDEKIGQMLQLNVSVLFKDANNPVVFDSLKTDSILRNFHVGSFLNTPNFTPTKEQWNYIISYVQNKSIEIVGIPTLYGLDQNHGVSYTNGGTFFPQEINVAATFNPELAHSMGEVCAYENRACNCPWTFCPTLDLDRNQCWPRLWENFGEDAYLSSVMAREAVRGYQGDNPNHIDQKHIAVTAKHFMGYSAPLSGRDRTPAVISLPDLKEKHFAPFKSAIQAGALSVMVNSASVNGIPCHANTQFLTGWLKDGLNWDGMIITDWADIDNLYTREAVAKDKKEAIKKAINAGIDMSMDPYDCNFCILLKELVNEGEVSKDRIDDACRRILRMKFRLGLFDCPNTSVQDFPEFNSENYKQKSYQAALESMVLLKNDDNILPLKNNKKILVCGPNANSMRTLNGGWSYTWQGENTDAFTTNFNTILEALQSSIGNENIIYSAGVEYDPKGDFTTDIDNIQSAIKAATKADLIIACIGENSYTETVGNIDDLSMSINQKNLIFELSKTGKPIILIINGGRPRIIREIEPLCSAIVDIFLPSNYGGDALADLLTGKADFSGRMPYSYPKYANALINYDYKTSAEVGTMEGAYDYEGKINAQWLFGFGLQYANVKYSNLTVNKTDFYKNDEIEVSVDVENLSNHSILHSVLLFSSDIIASLVPDVRRLRAFEKIELNAGEKKTVNFKLPLTSLSFVDADEKWTLEKGEYRLQIEDQYTIINSLDDYKYE